MKIVNIIGIIIATIASIIGYVNYEYWQPVEPPFNPEEAQATAQPARQAWAHAQDAYIDTATYVLFAGVLAFILCLIPAIKKKDKWAFVGLILSLVAFLIGAATGTHLFS